MICKRDTKANWKEEKLLKKFFVLVQRLFSEKRGRAGQSAFVLMCFLTLLLMHGCILPPLCSCGCEMIASAGEGHQKEGRLSH